MNIAEPSAVLQIVNEAMAATGNMSYPKVAKLAKMRPQTVQGVGEQTKVGTLRAIASGLGCRLVITIERDEQGGAE